MLYAKSIKAARIAAAVVTALFASVHTYADAFPTASLLASEDVIGEELVSTANVNAFADRVFAETARILASSSWTSIPNFNNVKNEYKGISGVFASSGVYLTRAKATVNVPAQQLFDYLTTAKGYQLIDPYSNPDDFAKAPIEKFATDKWRPSSKGAKRLEAAHTISAAVPIIKEREFVVLNAIDAGSRTFVSKSIQHAGWPGCSKYGGAGCFNATAERVRALNSFSVQIDPLPTNASQAVVQLVNYADFTGEVPAAAMNTINFSFLKDMVGRMRTAFP